MMFSPVKTIAAAALATVIASVLFIAQPLDRQAGTPGAVSAVVGESTGVTGTSSCWLQTEGTFQGATAPYSLTAQVLTCDEGASDPRVTGRSTVTLNIEGWGEGLKLEDPANSITWHEYTLEGPEGDWSGQGYGFYDAEGDAHLLSIAAGAGAYEGLTYVRSFTVPAGTASAVTVGLIQAGSPPPGFPTAPLSSPVDE